MTLREVDFFLFLIIPAEIALSWFRTKNLVKYFQEQKKMSMAEVHLTEI